MEVDQAQPLARGFPGIFARDLFSLGNSVFGDGSWGFSLPDSGRGIPEPFRTVSLKSLAKRVWSLDWLSSRPCLCTEGRVLYMENRIPT